MLVGRCLSYGEGITFLPLREIVQQATADGPGRTVAELLGGLDDRDAVAARIGGLVGLDETDLTSEEAFGAVRRLIEALGHERPLVLVVEDIHWAEPSLLDLLDDLCDWVRDAPVMLLCLARPELLDARPTWGGGKHNAVSLLLEPLPEGGRGEPDRLPPGRRRARALDARAPRSRPRRATLSSSSRCSR